MFGSFLAARDSGPPLQTLSGCCVAACNAEDFEGPGSEGPLNVSSSFPPSF